MEIIGNPIIGITTFYTVLLLQSRIQENGLETICLISLVNIILLSWNQSLWLKSIGGSSKDECERATILDVQN